MGNLLDMKERIILRTYSKVIFLLPTLIVSIIGWVIQAMVHTPVLWLEIAWLLVFLANLFVICFDFSSSKFIILVLTMAFLGTILYFLVFPHIFNPKFFRDDFKLVFGFTSHFYILITGVLSFYIIIALVISFFDYYIIERNELYHRKGLFTMTERWALINLKFQKEIPDIFEYMMFRAGTLKFIPNQGDTIVLPTVLNIGRKERILDRMLSKVAVDIKD